MAKRQNTFLLKRSNVPGKVPSPGDLQLGELALNTADVILYASGTTVGGIIPIGWDRIHRTGDTVTGNFTFNGDVKMTTISASTYYNLPLDIYTSGLTLSNGSVIFNNTNQPSAYSFTLTGAGITVLTDNINKIITLSAATFSLPTLNQAQIFIGDNLNTAQARSVTGDISLNYTGLTTIQNGVVTYNKIQNVSQQALLGSSSLTGGTVEEIPFIEAYISTGSTPSSLLDDVNNWDINGVYTGTTITGTYQGQSHYNQNYWFTAVDDNLWIRLIRG